MTNEDIAPLTMLATCTNGTCPTIFATGRGTLLVQGYVVTAEAAAAAGVELPAGEQFVEIPQELLQRAARAAGSS